MELPMSARWAEDGGLRFTWEVDKSMSLCCGDTLTIIINPTMAEIVVAGLQAETDQCVARATNCEGCGYPHAEAKCPACGRVATHDA